MTTNAESSQEHNPFADHSQSVTPEILIDPLTRSSTIALQIESVDSNPDADRQSNVSLQSNTNDTMDDSLTSMQTNRSSVSAIPTDLLPRFHLNEQSPYEPDQLHSDLDLRYLLASAHLSDACEGLEPQFRTDRASVRLYCFYRRPFIRHFLLFVLLVHHSLAFWEPITVEDRQRYPPSSTRVQYVMLIELCCLSYYGMLLALRSRFLPPLRFYADRKHLLLLCTLLLTLVDMLLFVAVPARHALRWSVAFRPLYAINLAESRPVSFMIQSHFVRTNRNMF